MMSLRHVGLRSYAGVMARTLGQFVAVLLVVGFVGAYFWWIVVIAATSRI